MTIPFTPPLTAGHEVLIPDGRVAVLAHVGGEGESAHIPPGQAICYVPSKDSAPAVVVKADELLPVSEVAAFVNTPEAGEAIIRALMTRFGFSGTFFGRGDVESAVESAMESVFDGDDDDEVADGYIESIVNEVIDGDGYRFRKMADVMSERGNETLCDAASSVVSDLTPGDGRSYCVVAGVDDADGSRVPMVEAGPFPSFLEAHKWGVAHLGVRAEVALSHDEAEPYGGGEELDSHIIAGFTVAISCDGETVRELDYGPRG